MRNCKFNIGDRVQIRQWDDMVNEFGDTRNGHAIDTNEYLFVDEMKYLCGIEGTIDKITPIGRTYKLLIDTVDTWTITDEMVEHIDKVEEFTIDEINSILNLS